MIVLNIIPAVLGQFKYPFIAVTPEGRAVDATLLDIVIAPIMRLLPVQTCLPSSGRNWAGGQSKAAKGQEMKMSGRRYVIEFRFENI